MNLVFSLYDFDNDGYIQREDVKLLLSYIPFRNKTDGSSISLGGSSTSLSQEDEDQAGRRKTKSNQNFGSPREGLYSQEDGKDMGI